MAKKLKVTQVRSVIHTQKDKHKVVMQSLGFKKNQRTLYKNDNPQIRGMIEKVRDFVVWEEIDEKDIPAGGRRPVGFTVIAEASGKGRSSKKKAASREDD